MCWFPESVPVPDSTPSASISSGAVAFDLAPAFAFAVGRLVLAALFRVFTAGFRASFVTFLADFFDVAPGTLAMCLASWN